MIQLRRCVLKAGLDVLRLQIGIIGQDFHLRNSCRQQVQNIPDADAHPPDARAAAALPGIESNSIRVFHNPIVPSGRLVLKAYPGG